MLPTEGAAVVKLGAEGLVLDPVSLPVGVMGISWQQKRGQG
jgi:hypothetical protein